MEKKHKFSSLTPEVLPENQTIYTEALDFAFSNNDIKNIAITGIYGSGKSSVWKTYERHVGLKNVVTVTLGVYEDNLDDELQNDFYKNEKINDYESENRLEKQLINQILSQIPVEQIPLSKYRFKENKSRCKLLSQVFMTIAFLVSIVLWVLKDDNALNAAVSRIIGDNASTWIMCMYIIGIIVPISYFLYGFYKENKIRLTRINLKGAEANLKDDDDKDESILDRDIKEIVYALSHSNTNVVVFEDLDRYENIAIFTKLRELNFLVNSHLKMKNNNRIIRFVYMLRDGLFITKNRTKFFDFILPIVPIIDSKNSENKLIELLGGGKNTPNNKTLAKISLYIDDMRLLKNIINEFNVYIDIVAFDELSLDSDKLLALIVLKNIFPREFDLLQEDKGFVYQILKNIDEYRVLIKKQLNENNEKLSKEIDQIKKDINVVKTKIIAELIPSSVSLNHSDSITWIEILTDWEENKNDIKSVYSTRGPNKSLNYDEFISEFILSNAKSKERLNLFEDIDQDKEIQERMKAIKDNKTKETNVLVLPIRDLMMIMSTVDIQNIFITQDSELAKNHYFPLIKYLIIEGLVDETYWHYKGYFYKGSLEKKDTIFMKNLLEGAEQDILIDLENPLEVINRLEENDYRRYNILNKRLLEQLLLKSDEIKKIHLVIDTIKNYNLFSSTISILADMDDELVKLFVSIVFDKDADFLVTLIDQIKHDFSNVFSDVLLSIYTLKNPLVEKLSTFNSYIESNENIITEVKNEDFEIFLENIHKSNVKFQNLTESNADNNMLTNISQIQAYELNINNVRFLLNSLIAPEIRYGEWISTIFEKEELISMKEYIKGNFIVFIEEYISSKPADSRFMNRETELALILKSEIDLESKLNYLISNQTMIDDMSALVNIEDNEEIIKAILKTNKLKFTSDNLNKYWNSTNEHPHELVEYININLTKENAISTIKECPEIFKALVKNSKISDDTFEIMYKFIDFPIENLGYSIPEKRVVKLISRNLVLLNEDNLSFLFSSQYLEAIVLLAKQSDYEEFTSFILASSTLLEVIDAPIVNALISSEMDENMVISLINGADVEVVVSAVPNNKIKIMEYVLSNRPTSEDINYIALNFLEFPLKKKLISIMTREGLFDELSDDSLSRSFMSFALSSSDVTLNTKIGYCQ